jgi:PKD repeat protein
MPPSGSAALTHVSSRIPRRIPILLALATGVALALPAGASAAVTGVDISPAVPNVGQTATLTATFDNTPDSVAWDFDSDGTTDATGNPVTHAFTSPGPNTVTVTATTGVAVSTLPKGLFVNVPPVAEFAFNPAMPTPGQSILFANNSTDQDNGVLSFAWNFGDGTTSTDRNPTHAYLTPGTKVVRLTTSDPYSSDDVTHNVTVIDPSAPRAAFGFSPARPIAGQGVTFQSNVQPSAGQRITGLNWDLDSDGQFNDAKGASATYVFESQGVYRVALEALQSNGTRAVAEGTVRVDNRPGILRPARIHLRAALLQSGARVQLLGVRAPRGSLATVRCRGRGCPAKQRRKAIGKAGSVRFKTYQRWLRAGVRLEIYVRKAGTIGVYTRYTIRGDRRNPRRTDACLLPNATKPTRCPS